MTWSGLRRRAVVATLMLALGCTASGQGNDAEQRATTAAAFATVTTSYEAEMAQVQQRGREALAAGDRDAILDVYRALGDATATVAEKYAAIDAPPGVRAQHAALLDNLEQQRAALGDVVNAASDGQDGQLTQALGELGTLLADFTTIHAAIDQELADGG